MITKRDLVEAIAECQGTRSPNANTAVKLAAFYTILDHLDDEKQPAETAVDRNSFKGYSLAESPNIVRCSSAESPNIVRCDLSSEFARAIDGKQQADVWPVLDELMSTIQAMNSRLYNGVMKKLTN